MSTLEIGLYIAPCLIEVFLQYLELRRAHNVSSLIAFLAFLFFTLGLVALVGATSYKEHPYHLTFWAVVRFCLGVGAILWITSQVLWFRTKVKILPHNGHKTA